MPAHPSSPIALRRAQRGTALVVSLIMLLVLTIIGVAAMNSSIMQGLMSTSYQSQTTTLSGAEAVLREGELDVEALLGAAKPAYYYDLVAEPPDDPLIVEDLLAQPWTFNANAFDDDTFEGQYAIEYVGRFEVPGETVVLPGGVVGSYVYAFKVTARTGGDRGAQRTVQSVYVTLEAP
jgi:type IV pilus assembly protein PilX